jgi:hypothetical protein
MEVGDVASEATAFSPLPTRETAAAAAEESVVIEIEPEELPEELGVNDTV